jgi:putative flippase GtrA
MKINMNMDKLMHIISYLFFGVLTTVINIWIYKIFLDLGVDYKLSACFAFIVAVLFAFITNRKYVFETQTGFWKEATAFFGMRLVTFFINLLGLIVLVKYFYMDKFYSQIFINVLVIILNYILSKFVVFNLHKIKAYLQKVRVTSVRK